MAKTVVKVVADSDTHKLRFEYTDEQGKAIADFLNGLLNEATAKQEAAKEADRFEQLAKEVEDRELRAYYSERAKEAREGSPSGSSRS